MRLALLGIGLAVLTLAAPAAAQQTRATPVPAASSPAPKYERRSTPVMAAGIVLTSFGAVSLIGGATTIGLGYSTHSCRIWGDPCEPGVHSGLVLIGTAVVVFGAGIGLGLGIPLWYVGAYPVPVRPSDKPTTATAPTVSAVVGPGTAGLRWTF